jgi:hypothetical protein
MIYGIVSVKYFPQMAYRQILHSKWVMDIAQKATILQGFSALVFDYSSLHKLMRLVIRLDWRGFW